MDLAVKDTGLQPIKNRQGRNVFEVLQLDGRMQIGKHSWSQKMTTNDSIDMFIDDEI